LISSTPIAWSVASWFEEMLLPSVANDLRGGGGDSFVPCFGSSAAMRSVAATTIGIQNLIAGPFG
jgi:hypothetical protein